MGQPGERKHLFKLSLLAAASVVLLSMLTDAISGNFLTGWLREPRHQFVWGKVVLALSLLAVSMLALWLLAREARGHRLIEVATEQDPGEAFERLIVAVSAPPTAQAPAALTSAEGWFEITLEDTLVTVQTTNGKKATMRSLDDAVKLETWSQWGNCRGPNVQQFFYVVHAARKARQIVLIATKDSRELAEHLQGALTAWGRQALVHDKVVNPHDVKEVHDVTESLLGERPRPGSPQSIVDITIGTKAMTVGMALAALDAKAVILYVDNDHAPSFRDLRMVSSEVAEALS
jgi:CRISPR-associated protein (Cas_Cas02710)